MLFLLIRGQGDRCPPGEMCIAQDPPSGILLGAVNQSCSDACTEFLPGTVARGTENNTDHFISAMILSGEYANELEVRAACGQHIQQAHTEQHANHPALLDTTIPHCKYASGEFDPEVSAPGLRMLCRCQLS